MEAVPPDEAAGCREDQGCVARDTAPLPLPLPLPLPPPIGMPQPGGDALREKPLTRLLPVSGVSLQHP